jgi:hypothetical protein
MKSSEGAQEPRNQVLLKPRNGYQVTILVFEKHWFLRGAFGW